MGERTSSAVFTVFQTVRLLLYKWWAVMLSLNSISGDLLKRPAYNGQLGDVVLQPKQGGVGPSEIVKITGGRA